VSRLNGKEEREGKKQHSPRKSRRNAGEKEEI
jgi:hypothetical protein